MLALLDGGLGHEFKRLHGGHDFFAGVRACLHSPELVKSIHRTFFEAPEIAGWHGLGIATTLSFVATPYHMAHHHSALDPVHIATCAAKCASAEAAYADDRRIVAGCLPPLGQCYAPCRSLDSTFYATLSLALVAGGANILLAETLASSAEAVAAASQDAPAPIWVCFTLADDASNRLRSGEALTDALHAISRLPHVAGIGANCSDLASIDAAVPLLADHAFRRKLEVVCYANAFKSTTSEWLRSIGRPDCARPMPLQHGVVTPATYALHAARWADRGATVIGGCCGTTPDHMAAVGRTLAEITLKEDDRWYVTDPEGIFNAILDATRPLRTANAWRGGSDGDTPVTPFCRKLGVFESAEKRLLTPICELPDDHRQAFLLSPGRLLEKSLSRFFMTPVDEPNIVPAMTVHLARNAVFKILSQHQVARRQQQHHDARPQCLALAMARYPKTGENSSPDHFPPLILERIFRFIHVPPDRGATFFFHRRLRHAPTYILGVGIVTVSGFAVGFEYEEDRFNVD